MTTTYRRIKSVQLAMELLKSIAVKVQPVSSKEIAENLGEAHSTVMCHLATLEDGGFVRRVGDRYELGLYLATIRASVKRSRELVIEQARKDLNLIENS